MPYQLYAVSDDCVRGPAGVAAIHILYGADVQSLLFNQLDRVSSIVLKAGATLKKVEFEEGAASFRQTESRVSGFPRVTQRLTFEHDGIPNQLLRAIKRLAEHCNVHVIVESNQGQTFYMGVSFYADRGYLWDTGNSVVTVGSANIDKIGGQVRTSTTLEAITRNYAPEVEADISTLPVTEPPPPDPAVDTTPPVAIFFTPPDDGVGISITPTISVHFNETVKAASGSLRVKTYIGDTLVATVTLSNVSAVTFDNVTNSFTVIFPITLSYNTHYYIEVDSGAVEDLEGNAWGGISSKDDWDFTTQATPDVTPPSLVTLTPADNATGVNPAGLNAVIELDEDVMAGVGNIYLFDDDDNLIKAYDINVATFAGDTVTLDISAEVAAGMDYYFLIGAGVITDLAGNPWAGIAAKGDWNFATTAIETAYLTITHNKQTGFSVTIDGGEGIVDWGDSNTQVYDATSGPLVLNKNYASAGTYVVELQAFDGDEPLEVICAGQQASSIVVEKVELIDQTNLKLDFSNNSVDVDAFVAVLDAMTINTGNTGRDINLIGNRSAPVSSTTLASILDYYDNYTELEIFIIQLTGDLTGTIE